MYEACEKLGHVSNTNFMKYSAVLKFSSWSSGSTKEVSADLVKKILVKKEELTLEGIQQFSINTEEDWKLERASHH